MNAVHKSLGQILAEGTEREYAASRASSESFLHPPNFCTKCGRPFAPEVKSWWSGLPWSVRVAIRFVTWPAAAIVVVLGVVAAAAIAVPAAAIAIGSIEVFWSWLVSVL